MGGLLSTTDENGTTHYATYDGNGNVSEYLNEDGDSVAHYEYDPFGSTVTQSGDRANDFSFKFSTKYQDSETGFYYYGYRYYDTVTGRWLSRDPIEEEGGINLYGFVANDGVNESDLLGMDCNTCGGQQLTSGQECCGGIPFTPGRTRRKRCCGNEIRGDIWNAQPSRGPWAGFKEGDDCCRNGRLGTFKKYWDHNQFTDPWDCISSMLGGIAATTGAGYVAGAAAGSSWGGWPAAAGAAGGAGLSLLVARSTCNGLMCVR